MSIDYKRVTEMLSDLEDFEIEWNQFETDFLMNVSNNLAKYEDKFKFFGKQEETFQKIYDKYCKKVQY